MESTTAGLLVAIAACVLYYGYLLALPRPIATIPYVEAESKSLLGSMPGMISHINKHGLVLPWLLGQNARHNNAPLVQFFGLPFSKPTLVLSDWQETQDVLIRRTKEFDRAARTLESFVGIIPDHHISMKTQDPRFKGNKELVRDLMSPSFLQDVNAVQIYNKGLALIQLWTVKTKAANGRPFAARQDLFDAAMDMINAAAFGFEDDLSITKQAIQYLTDAPVKIKDDDTTKTADKPADFIRPDIPPKIASLRDSVEFLGSQIMSPLPLYTYWWRILTDSKVRRQLAAKDEIIKSQLTKSLKRLESGDDTQISATDYMIQREFSVANKEKRAPDFYSRRTIDELFGYIVGGHDTTSTSLSWMLKYIADCQHVQTKLRQTLKEGFSAAVAESRLPTAVEIFKANIPYLDATIEESLRLGTPAPMVAREAVEDTVLLGHNIPKGCTLLISQAGPSYLSKPADIPDSVRSETSRTKQRAGSWDPEDMEEFKPERWLKQGKNGETVYDPQAGPMLTFSLGPRGCFGRKLAYLEIRLILTLVLWSFNLRKLDGELASYETEESVTRMPKHCYVGLDIL